MNECGWARGPCKAHPQVNDLLDLPSEEGRSTCSRRPAGPWSLEASSASLFGLVSPLSHPKPFWGARRNVLESGPLPS